MWLEIFVIFKLGAKIKITLSNFWWGITLFYFEWQEFGQINLIVLFPTYI
jgi:hypothetical protein